MKINHGTRILKGRLNGFIEEYPNYLNTILCRKYNLSLKQTQNLGHMLKLYKRPGIRKKINIGRSPPIKGKTYEEMYGKEKAEEIKKLNYYGHKDNDALHKKRVKSLRLAYKNGYQPHNKGKTKVDYSPLMTVSKKREEYWKSVDKEKLFKMFQKAGQTARKTMNKSGWMSKPQKKLGGLLKGIISHRIAPNHFVSSKIANFHVIDWYSPKLNIGFECDGKKFHNQKKDEIRDKEILELHNIKIFRFDSQDIMKKGDEIMKQIQKMLDGVAS